jgi:VIT1/CCC1 family predicted Fe2+/Mn2+ transporter
LVAGRPSQPPAPLAAARSLWHVGEPMSGRRPPRKPRASHVDQRRAQAHQASERHLGAGSGGPVAAHTAWLRAAVLGANDGLVSTAALMVGVAAAASGRSAILVAGIAGLTAGALSMAAGEYVSVSSQRDAEEAELARERVELATAPEAERDELAAIYRKRGLSAELAERVADELSQQDRLAVHARDELGVDLAALANPLQAAVSSAASFVVGALIPIAVVLLAPSSWRLPLLISSTLAALAALGTFGARLGGAPMGRAALRVLVGGALALGVSLGIGHLTGLAV